MRKTSVRPRLFGWLLLLLLVAACGRKGRDTTAPAPVTLTPISSVQGNGRASPLEGQVVTVTGVVTGDFQDGDADSSRNLGGFFLQAESPDDDPATSDGIFVFDANAAINDVVAGQIVQVTGTVTEHFSETQLVADLVTITGAGQAQSAGLSLPVSTRLNADGEVIADLERFEGMLVSVNEPVFVTETYNLEQFGEISVSVNGRLRQFTNESRPDAAGFADHRRRNAGRTLILDDGMAARNPGTYRYLRPESADSPGYILRSGDTVTAVAGNIRYSRGSGASGTEAYRLEPVAEPQFELRNPRVDTPPATGGALRIASFNVLNYFTSIDDGQPDCGPVGDTGCRGADSAAEFDRQHAKTINTLIALNADVVGLMELENNGGAALRNIVDGLNARTGDKTWDFVDTGVIGTDAIAVGLIYRTSAVEPAGDFAILTSAVDSRFDDQKNRPSLAQSFDAISSVGRFTVAVNHLKSKGSDCSDIGDPNRDDGQGECSGTRTRAAAALGDWLNADPTGSNDPDILVIGDMNAYLHEDPLVALEQAGFTNLLKNAGSTEAYSFVFDGQAGALDHAFASRSLAVRISGIVEWHINADEPALIDYNLDFGRDPGLFDESTPFRASDHDPVVVGIDP